MKVLHVIGKPNFGGLERLALDLAIEQKKSGDIVPAIMFTEMRGDFLKHFTDAGLDLRSAELRGGYDASPVKYRRITQIFREYDILHLHSFNPFLALCALSSGRRIVYTEHGNFGFGRKWRMADGIKKCLLRSFLNRRVDFLTFNSEFTRGVAEKRYGLRGVKQEVVLNGIDVEGIRGNAEAIDGDVKRLIDGRFVVGTSSRFAGFKRIDRLVRAYAGFQQGRPDVALLLVGDGVERDRLAQLADRLGVADSVVFAGYRTNVYDYQCAMDVAVFPSQSEPFGLVAVETLLLGVPTVVLRDGGGLVETVGGFARADVAEDVDGLADRIGYYYAHRERIAQDREARRAYARQFSVAAMSAKFARIYAEC